MHLVQASLDGVAAIRHYASLGVLDGTAESDHKLAWSLLGPEANGPRDFVFRVASRSPFTLHAVCATLPPLDTPMWTITARPYEVRHAAGSVVDIACTAALVRSERPTSPKGRGKKHDLVSASLNSLRSGSPDPEVSHLGPDARRGDVVGPATLTWFVRASARLGIAPVSGEDGLPLFHAEVSQASRDGRSAPKDAPAIRAIDLRARVRVTDPDAFARVLAEGIGTMKAYGYGMVRATPVG